MTADLRRLGTGSHTMPWAWCPHPGGQSGPAAQALCSPKHLGAAVPAPKPTRQKGEWHQYYYTKTQNRARTAEESGQWIKNKICMSFRS